MDLENVLVIVFALIVFWLVFKCFRPRRYSRENFVLTNYSLEQQPMNYVPFEERQILQGSVQVPSQSLTRDLEQMVSYGNVSQERPYGPAPIDRKLAGRPDLAPANIQQGEFVTPVSQTLEHLAIGANFNVISSAQPQDVCEIAPFSAECVGKIQHTRALQRRVNRPSTMIEGSEVGMVGWNWEGSLTHPVNNGGFNFYSNNYTNEKMAQNPCAFAPDIKACRKGGELRPDEDIGLPVAIQTVSGEYIGGPAPPKVGDLVPVTREEVKAIVQGTPGAREQVGLPGLPTRPLAPGAPIAEVPLTERQRTLLDRIATQYDWYLLSTYPNNWNSINSNMYTTNVNREVQNPCDFVPGTAACEASKQQKERLL